MNRETFLGELFANWPIKKVKYCFDISKEKAHAEDPVILSLARSGIKIRDISNNEGQIAESYEDYNPVVPGDLLLNPMDLYSGDNCNVSEVSGVISPAYINLKSHAGINPYFFNYLFKFLYWSKALQANGKGVSFEHRWTLSPNVLLNMFIPVPSKEEQDAIVEYLKIKINAIDELIKQANEERELLKERFLQIINEEIDRIKVDRKTPLKYIATCNDESLSSATDPDFFFEYIDISSVNLSEGITDTEPMTFQMSPSRARRIVKKNDVIVSTVRTYLKAVAVIDEEHEDCIVSTGFAVIHPSEKINHEYLGYFLRSDEFTNEVSRNSFGVSYPAIQSERLMNLKIKVPDEKVQLLTVENIKKRQSRLNELIKIKEDLVTKYTELKKNLIFDFVTGRRRVPYGE